MSELEAIEEEREVMSRHDVTNFLVAIGVNTCFRSYDNTHKKLSASFLDMALKDIAPTWDHLDDTVKIAVLNKNIDEFRTWIMESR